MIKIKRIGFEQFCDQLERNAINCGHELTVFSKNKFENYQPGFYYNIKNKKVTIYYETGEKSKSGGITKNKSFLLCFPKKLFGKEKMFFFLVDNCEYWPFVFIIFVYGILFGNTLQTIILELLSIIGLFFVLNFKQKIILLDFIDELCEYNQI